MKKVTKKTLFTLSLQGLIFLILYLLSRNYFQNYYLLAWTAHNRYLYLWLLIMVLTLLNKFWWSWILTLANVIALPIAQGMGDLWRARNLAKMTPGMSPEEQYQLQLHHGWWIWILVVLLGFFLGWWVQRKKTSQLHTEKK